VGQAIRLDLHRRKPVPEKARAKKRPRFVNFRLVAVQELSDLRGDAGNMNMQLILAAASCRINRKTTGYIDLGTRKPHADALVGRHTDVVDDGPQPTPLGGRGRMRQIRDSGEDQLHGRRETSDFAQDEPFRNAAHCRIKAGPVPIVNEYM
jgi:hypothetical protein